MGKSIRITGLGSMRAKAVRDLEQKPKTRPNRKPTAAEIVRAAQKRKPKAP